MNCKPGDLAFVRPTFDRAMALQDKIVKVIEYCNVPGILNLGPDWWLCECSVRFAGDIYGPREIPGKLLEIPDSWLRRIDDTPGNESWFTAAPRSKRATTKQDTIDVNGMVRS